MCFLAEVTRDRRIVMPRAVARGNERAVLAAARDANAGEILLHNHPSGVLEPSPADLSMAARVYEAGVGSGIIDNDATELYVVVEPPAPRVRARLDPDQIETHLLPGGALSELFEGYEDRPAQREMLREVTRRFNDGGVAIVEAGTGTGKSLAYLLPAVTWAIENGERTVVSTNTINLQEQLVAKDLPSVRRILGRDFQWALVKGRGNYISIRRLHLARQTAPDLFEDDRAAELDALVDWVETTRDGSLSDLVSPPMDEVWEEVRSDGDICMGARCPHFQECFYQKARRRANAADLLVVNHALLFADVSLRSATENWSQSAVLPVYRHVVLDEGHNVEDVATSHLGAEVTRVGLFRTLGRLERNGKGLLRAVQEALGASGSTSSEGLSEWIEKRVRPALGRARQALSDFFDVIEPRVPGEDEEPLRLGRGDPRDPGADAAAIEALDALRGAFNRLRRDVEDLRTRLEEDETLSDLFTGRVLDLQSIERRLEAADRGLGLVLDPERDGERFVRWIEGRGRSRGGGLSNVRLAAAPVEPGELLRDALYHRVDTTVVTSATLSTGGGFDFLRGRLGLGEPRSSPSASSTADPEMLALADGGVPFEDLHSGEALEEPLAVTETLLASPFDYASQTLFCVPNDLPGHDAGRAFQEATCRVVLDLAARTDGGIFVLFTSYRALRTVAALIRSRGADTRWPLSVHGEAPRARLLQDFVRSGRGILLGTASFWEGVDVPGEPLRALVLQKIPFRVPTEPITQARMEAIEARGIRSFDAYQVPLAALRLKQGFGRLIRTRKDRGAVLLLDRRILTRGYGRALRSALPPAPLVKGPWEEVLLRLDRFYGVDR